jgi:hypothetical protein
MTLPFVDLPVVPVGHYLGLVYDDGVARHRVRIGARSEPLDPGAEAAVWFAAHGAAEDPGDGPWTRDRILSAVPDPAAGAAVFATMLADGVLAEVDAGFADRFRVVPLTFGLGWQTDDSLALGARERQVTVGATVLAVWERGAEHPTLRAACVAAAPEAADAAVAAVLADLHRLLAVSAAYVDVALSTVDGSAASR